MDPVLPNEVPESMQVSEQAPEFYWTSYGSTLTDVESYRYWARSMKLDLKRLKMDHFIDKDFALYGDPQSRDYSPEKEFEARAILTSRLGEQAFDHIYGLENLQTIWTKLEEKYLEMGWVAESRLISDLVSIKYHACNDVEDYIFQFRKTLRKHYPIDRRIHENILIYLVLAGLDMEIAEVIWANLGNRQHGSEPPRFDAVVERLLHQKLDEVEEKDLDLSTRSNRNSISGRQQIV